MSEEPRKILSNISTVSGSKAHKAQEKAISDPKVKAEQLELARKIAREEFEKVFPSIKRQEDVYKEKGMVSKEEQEALERQRIEELRRKRLVNTMQMIATPSNRSLYTMADERALYTNKMLVDMITEMQLAQSKRESTVIKVSQVLRENLVASLFGCDVHIGVCTDANAEAIEFLGESDYTRREKRGLSTIFECLEQEDLVVSAILRPRTRQSTSRELVTPGGTNMQSSYAKDAEEIEEENTAGGPGSRGKGKSAITSGEAVVYVPLLGKRGGVGVIEIHGLFADQITDPVRYDRKTAVLQAMMNKQDFRFIHSLRLWRRPEDRIKNDRGITDVDWPHFNRSDYNLVCGRIKEVVHSKNGVPFTSGAHYAIAWEDGLFEESVSPNEMIKLYAKTPHSLGNTTMLDIRLTDSLLQLGLAAGEMLEKQRTKDALNLLRKKLFYPSLGEAETFERTLDICLGVVRGIRECSIVVWDEHDSEAVLLCTREIPTIYDRNLEFSFTEVTLDSIDSVTPFNPIIKVEQSKVVEWVSVELKVPTGYISHNNPLRRRLFATFVRSRTLDASAAAAEVGIFLEVITCLSECMDIEWQREQRNKHRKELIKQIEGRLFSWRSLSVQDICHNTTQIAATVLPGADVYSGVLVNNANSVQFLAATPNSGMVDKVLKRPAGVSFDVVENLETVVLQPGDDNKGRYLNEGTTCQVYYGRKPFKGRITKDRGHEKYDVCYLELKGSPIEAGVDIKRIVPMHTAFKVKTLGNKLDIPFICVPLRHRNKGIGVLGIDGIGAVPRAPYETQPESGMKRFLEQLGRILGTTIDLQKKKLSMKNLTLVTSNFNSGIDEVLEAAFETISENMQFVESIFCARILYESRILAGGKTGINVLRRWGLENTDAEKRVATFNIKRSNQKPVQLHGERNVWLLLKLHGMNRFVKGKIYVVSITQKVLPISDPDLDFLNVLQKVLKNSLQSIDLKTASGDSKSTALLDIKKMVSMWDKVNRDLLFNTVADRINQCYLSANIYLGRLTAHGKELNFILASQRSNMKGKRLPRDKKNTAISIQAIDEMNRTVITPSMDKANNLVHFGPPEGFEYPYVAIPLVAHIDSPVGVLCGDACEDPSADAEDTGDVLSFFGAVGMHLSEAVRGYSAQDAMEALNKIALEYSTVRQGMREIKRVVLGVLPYATRVSEVCYEPRETHFLATNDLGELDDIKSKTSTDFVLLVRVLKSKCTAANVTSPVLIMNWMGQQIYKCNIKRRMDTKPMKLRIHRGTFNSKVQLQLTLQGNIDGTRKDVSKKTLTMQYLSNVPTYPIEHVLDSLQDANVHVGGTQIVTKIFASNQIVEMCILSITIRGLAKADEFGLSDPFVIVKWNGDEIGKTTVIQDNLDPVWKDLKFELRIGSINPFDCSLFLEVWDQDLIGRGDFLGCVILEGEDLVSLFTSNSNVVLGDMKEDSLTQDMWIPLVNHPKMATETQTLVQGRMKMTGTVIVAGDLTEAQMNHELDIMGQMDVAGGVEGDGMDEEEGEGYHECELRVVSARDLSLSESRAVPSSFAIVRFNNEELGRTAVLDGTENPEWEDETFTIRAPGGDRLEECNLNVEIYHVGSGGKGEFIGQAILTGKELVSLIAATRFKSRWIDVIEPGNTISGGGRGQIQLGGRPSSVDIDGVMPKAPEKGILEIGVLSSRGVAPWSLTNYDSAMSAGNNKRKFYFQVKFNDKVIHRSVAVSLTKPAKNNKSVNKDETFVESKMSSLLDESFEGNQSTLSSVDDATVYPLVWSKGQANAARLRHPNKRALSDCELEVEIWSSEVVENDHERADSADEGADKGNSHGNEDDNNVEKLEEKAIAKLQLKGRELDSLLGKQGFKTRWVPLQVKSSEFGVFSYEMKLRCGPEGSEDYYDLDGREIWLDIMGTSDIPRRSAHVFSEIFLHNIDKYNTYFHNQCSPMVVVRWNGKIIGETVTVRNDVDAIWSNMRFVIRPPLIDDVRESLFMCELVLEIYDMGPGHVATNKYAESHHSRDEEHEHIRVLIGRVVLKGRSLVDFMAGDEAENVSWFSIAGPDPSLEESKYYDVNSEKSHPFGQVRVRAAPAGTTSAVPSPKLRADSLLHIVCASDLAKPDAFSESNPYVLVDLNGTQLYRTDEVRDNSNPEFNNHLVFHIDTLRNYFSSTSERGNEESKEIDTKKKSADELVRLGMMGQIDRLTISVMNHNVIPHQMDEFLGSRVWLGHQIEEFLRQDVSDLTLELNESVELLPEENEYVQGSISLNISSLPSAPDQVISQRDVVVHIKSVADIANTRAMGSGSDVHMKVFRRFRSEGNHEEKIYTTKIISSTLAPVFTDELVCISVPTSEEDDIWSGLVVRFELWDVATLDFLGCVVLKGKELYALVNHNDKSAFTDSEFPLVDLPNQSSKKNKSMIVGEEAVSLIKGVLTVTGGYKSYFDANYKSERVAEPEVLVEEAVEEEEVELIDESGEEIEVHIVRATDLPKADGFMGKSDPYCIVRWNEKEVGRTSVIYKELNPEWDEEKFKFSLAAMPESTEGEATEDAPEISLKSVLDIDIWDMDTLGSGDFLGTVQITGSALANLLSPEVDEVEYPLSPSSLLTPRGNKLATKGTITLKAALVNQQRADEIRAKKAREAKQREIEKNPGLQASRIELHIQSASDLAKVNMRGGANAYVKIYWLDNAEKSRSNDKLPPDAVSQVVNNSLNPEFDNEILYFEKTAGMKVSECNMRLCVYSKGTMRDEFLGEVNLTGADVVQALPTLNVHGEFIIKPETRDLVSGNMKDNSKYVKGKLTFALKQIGVEADDGESHSVLPPGMKEMELTVVAGSNLPKANAFGLSDPYCVVKWGSREVGKTVTISECCDPVYEDQMFILRVPDDLGLPYYVKEAANIEAEAKAFKKLQRRLAMEGKAHDDEEVTRVLALSKAAENAAPPKELFLSVDVYDWNALNSGIFMGCVELSGEELNEFAAGDRHKMQWFPLGVTRRMRKSDQSLVNAPTEADMEDTEWPRLELMLGPHNVTSGDEKTESEIVIHLQVCAARGLAKADTFGSADPYVKVFWNNQRVGTTAVISNNQTPIWDDEKYTLQIQHPWKLDECILYLEVWDSDTAGPGEFLGSLTLNGDELKNFVEESAFSPSWYELGGSDVLPAAIQDLAQGEIEIRLSEAGALNKVRETGQKFEIEIIGATNLARADGMFGLSDPYAIVKWNHNELGRTPYISKTLNPVWEEGNVFSVWVNMEDDVGNNLLQIDVWDYDMIGNGKFLGCAIIEDFDLDHQFKPAVLQDEDKTGTFDLKEDPRREGMTIPGNIQPKGQLEFKIRNPDDSNVTLASAMNLKWDSERDLNAGQPCFELDILSVNNLPITRVLSKSCSPKCFVYWNDDELGSTETGSSTNHTFADEHFTLKIPHLVEMNNVSLYVEVWDMESFGRGDLLGVVHLPFRAVLRLQFGECTLNLYQKDRNQYTRGTLTFHLKIAYPFWDSMAPLPPTKIMRKIGIYSAANLPGINDETPSTKGVIMVNGVIKTKTMISVKTSSPIWQKAECIVLVDLHKPIDVVIVVYHIDLKVKKEIAIGQFVVPFELLVRPPKSSFDASLSPPIKTPPKKYKFTVAGNVKISITPDDAAMNNMRPYSADIQRPEGSLVIHDISPHSASKSKQDILYDGEMLTEEQKVWLGTHVDFTRVETLPTRPNWIIMPIFDMGQRVGFKAVDLLGTKPGHRMALCIERPIDRKAISDPVILQDIWQAVNRCVNNLRRKEIYKVMRERAMERFAKFIQGATELEGFDGSQVDAWINDAISTCCPGVRFYTASVSPDFQSLRYTLFESNGSTRSFTIFQKQSNEWDFAGRHPPRSLIVKKASDFANRRITSYVPFPNTSLPRFVVPLAAGDVSLGFFGVEKFDVYLGRVGDDLTDERDLQKWFEDLGKLCGDVIYAGREKRALHEMETYTLGSTATKDGVVVEILRSCMHVLQGCKLMEVWQIDKNDHIRSLAAQQPPAAPLPGRKVLLKGMKLKIIGGKRTGGLMGLITLPPDENDEQNVLDAVGVGGGGFQGEGGSRPGTAATDGTGGLGDEGRLEGGEHGEESAESAFVDEVGQPVYHTFLVGLRYDGVEQLHQVKIEEQDLVVEIDLDMHFVITYDRNIHVTLYHIDKRAHTLEDWYGKIAFANFKETNMKTSLYTHKNTFANWDVEFSFEWDEESSVSVGSDVKVEDIKLFNLNIRCARDLMPCDGDTSDPFCEIYYDGTMIGKTKYIDKDLNPEFNEDFIVPFSGKKAPLIIDMFDMSMVGKGQFLGRVDIPFDLLITPPPGEFEYPLKIKSGLAARKQQKVGGMLTLAYSMEMRKVEQRIDAVEVAAQDINLLDIPQQVWPMKVPALYLTIHSALDLAKANLFGGGSDPFVVVYLDFKKPAEDPLFKTRVIDDNLSPVWEESFSIPLGVNMTPGATTAKDFPTIRLEVYDHNRIMKGEFLGICEIPPAVYFQRKNGEFKLGPKKSLSRAKNKLAQGELSASFNIQDSTSVQLTNDFKISEYGFLKGIPFVEVEIIKARKLKVAKRMTGRTDPYVVVRWNGVDEGETLTKRNTQDPNWTNEKVMVDLSAADFVIPDMTLEVWDRDFFTGGQFLGEVIIGADELLHPENSQEEIEAPLQPKRVPGEAVDKRVSGVLTYKLTTYFTKQRLTFPPKDFVEVKPANNSTFNPVDMRVVRDPGEEANRMKFDKLNIEGVVRKARQETDHYHSKPFERVGLISELHHGQMMSAMERTSSTVLKTDLADMICIPALKSTASEGKEGDGKDGKKKNPKGDKQQASAEDDDDPKAMYIVARYDSGKLPRRDVQYLERFQSILLRGLAQATHRKSRVQKREALDSNLLYMANNTNHLANDVIVHGIVEVESALGCKADMYMLMPDGKTFAQCNRTRGDPDINSAKANDFITYASKLCRHGLILQFFRGKITVCGSDWLTVSQMAMVNLDEISEEIDEIEGHGFCFILKDSARFFVPDGAFIIPMTSVSDSLMSLLVVYDLDKLPYAAYRVKIMDDGKRRKRKQAPNVKRKEFDELFGPEDGVTSVLRDAGKYLGVALLRARMGDCVKKMANFPVDPSTTLEDILRHVFRVLIVAVPTIRNISIWGVDFNRLTKLNKGSPTEQRKNWLDQLKAFLGFAGDKPLEKVNATDAQSPSKNVHREFPAVVCGFFGSENPSRIMHSHIQIMHGAMKTVTRKAFGGQNETKQVRMGARRSSAITETQVARRRKLEGESSGQEIDVDWALGIPNSLQKLIDEAAEAKQKEESAKKEKEEEEKKKKEWEDANKAKEGETATGGAVPQRRRAASTIDRASLQLNTLAAKSHGVADKEEGNSGEELASTVPKPRDLRTYTTMTVVDTEKIDGDRMALVHAETVRCTKMLEKPSFRVLTGQLLCHVGDNEESITAFRSLFGMIDPEPESDEEEEEKEKAAEGDATRTEGGVENGNGEEGGDDDKEKEQAKPTLLAQSVPDNKDAQLGASGVIMEEEEEESSSDDDAPKRSPRITGTSNVKSNNSSPRPDPNRPKAPLPPGPAPSGKTSPRSTTTTDADAKTSTSVLGLEELEMPPPAVTDSDIKRKRRKNRITLPNLRFFLTVGMDGIGGEYGYGICGDTLESLLGNVGKEIDNTVHRVVLEIKKADEKAKQQAELEALQAAKRAEEKEIRAKEAMEAKLEKERVDALKAKIAAESGNSSDGSSGSNGSGSKRRGSVSGRRNSVRRSSVSNKGGGGGGRRSSASSKGGGKEK